MVARLSRVILAVISAASAAAARAGGLLSARQAAAASGNPLFAPATCTEMFKTMQKLGSSVPPNDFVSGCTEVCAKVMEMKEYWGTGKEADYACQVGKHYGCAWVGTPPVALSDIGC